MTAWAYQGAVCEREELGALQWVRYRRGTGTNTRSWRVAEPWMSIMLNWLNGGKDKTGRSDATSEVRHDEQRRNTLSKRLFTLLLGSSVLVCCLGDARQERCELQVGLFLLFRRALRTVTRAAWGDDI
jgi:hypothetical protein